ncbi:IclR family transcriptional regulator [Paracoccus saliphilus]|uniref:IclR family transcriptional regulator n=1 Tax=Paracoccus saliphilus TaxID=405559 RepID=A0AA45W2R6_9RHOB|nr:IclR family transcriptional regulator [Paracoccus saliphilus]WCR01405.1 IclR family transcriptional regulator [Paracoccus saliphilus]SIS69910.1 transcriptional regulator, IclR family [Paracoccus saliphilus]
MNVKHQSGELGRVAEKPLERYVRALEVISGFPEGISPTAIAEMLNLPKATAYRLIRSLAEVGLVEMTAPPSASCRLGARLERLLFAGASDGWLRIVARPILSELTEQTGEACFMARFGGEKVRSVEMVAPDNHLRAYIVPGQEITPHTGASAKAILAFQPKEVREAALSGDLPRFTAQTKTDRKELLSELAEVRKAGIALCIGEDVDGFAGIAVPIIVPGFDVQLSICVTGTISALTERKRSLIETELKNSASRLVNLLEHRASLPLQS